MNFSFLLGYRQTQNTKRQQKKHKMHHLSYTYTYGMPCYALFYFPVLHFEHSDYTWMKCMWNENSCECIRLSFILKLKFTTKTEIKYTRTQTTANIHLIWIRVFNICYLSWQLLYMTQYGARARALARLFAFVHLIRCSFRGTIYDLLLDVTTQ